MKQYRTRLLVGTAAWGFCVLAAADMSVYSDDFESDTLAQRTQWQFVDVLAGVPDLLSTSPQPPLTATRFLAEFGGNDVVRLNLDLPQDTQAVRLRFDAYLLRSWDGAGVPYAGPDVFGFGIAGRDALLRASFSNGAGLQDYCPFSPTPLCAPTWASDPLLKNQLGFNVELEPAAGQTLPIKGTPLSLVYHFDSGSIPYADRSITFEFFSAGLQVRGDLANPLVDESWGLDNVQVSVQLVPEPATSALLLAGLLLAGAAARLRRRAAH